MATHSNILVWRVPWTEKPGGLYSPWGCKRVGQDLVTKQQQQQNVGWSSGCYMISEYLPKDFSVIMKVKVSLQWRDLPESCLTKPSSLASLSDQGTQ